MQKKTLFAFTGFMLFLILCVAAYGQQTPAVSLMNENNVVALGQEFVISVHVNTGTQRIPSFNMSLGYDSSLVQPVAATSGPDGLGMFQADISANPIMLFDLSEMGSVKFGLNLNVAVIRFKALKWGRAVFSLDPGIGVLTETGTTLLPPVTTTVSIVDPGTPWGDVNEDGSVNIVDAYMIATAPEAAMAASPLRTEEMDTGGQSTISYAWKNLNYAAADVNADMQFNILDALLIAQYSAGLIKELPVVAGLTKKNIELVPLYSNGLPPVVISNTQRDVSVKLRDAAGSPLADKEITFGGDYFAAALKMTTNGNGIATATLPVPTSSGKMVMAAFYGESTLMKSNCTVAIQIALPVTATPLPTPTPSSTTSVITVPFYFMPYMVTLTANPEKSSAAVRLTGFSTDSCTNITSWGTVQRSGNTFYADTTAHRVIGAMCLDVIMDIGHTYDLGVLEPGNYIFSFLNWGSRLKSVNFTIPIGN